MAHFIPQLWSAKILDALDNALVYSRLFNSDYEGEITGAGATVHIGSIGEVTVKPYTKGTAIADPDDVATTEQTLTIDQQEYFNIAISDIDAAQSKLNELNLATDRAGVAFAESTDKYLANTLVAAGTSTIGTEAAPTELSLASDNAYEPLVDMATMLDEANVPQAGRVVVVPNAFKGLMLKDHRFVSAGTSATDQRLASGTVYEAAGLTVLTSNNVPSVAKKGSDSSTTVYKLVATYPGQGTFAQQILKTEAYRVEKGFSDAVKGLHVYGAKVLRPKTVCVATVAFK